MLKDRVDTELHARRRWILLDYACTTLIGMLDDEVLGPDGFAAIDDYDFRDWLERHGATEQTRYSPIVALWYENSLAFRGGDMRYPDLSAAIALLGQLRASFTYKGSVAYSLQSEIGDSFIAPLYQALRNRGVRFRFFHRIWELQPHGADIARITVERQVELASGDPDDYQPLIRIGGRRYWPNRPLSAQFAAHEREKFFSAELQRLKGELLLMPDGAGTVGEAEACFQQALAIAHKQKAKSFELRAATSLARLRREQGRYGEAYALLAPLHGWFSEGFDCADLRQSQNLLGELRGYPESE